jgi:hypothetical protein
MKPDPPVTRTVPKSRESSFWESISKGPSMVGSLLGSTRSEEVGCYAPLAGKDKLFERLAWTPGGVSFAQILR